MDPYYGADGSPNPGPIGGGPTAIGQRLGEEQTVDPELLKIIMQNASLDEESKQNDRMLAMADELRQSGAPGQGYQAGRVFKAESPLETLARGTQQAGGLYKGRQAEDAMKATSGKQGDLRSEYLAALLRSQ
jgi:hypothetical protein